MVKVCVCSACGHPLPESGARAALSPLQKRLYDIVLRAGTAGITTAEIMNRLYEKDPNGGPESPNIIAVMAKNIRTRIEPFGITLVGTLGRGSEYHIIPLYRKNEFANRDVDSAKKG